MHSEMDVAPKAISGTGLDGMGRKSLDEGYAKSTFGANNCECEHLDNL